VEVLILVEAHGKLSSLSIPKYGSAGASLNDSPPELQQLALNFLATFLVVTFPHNDRPLVVTVHEIHLHGPFMC